MWVSVAYPLLSRLPPAAWGVALGTVFAACLGVKYLLDTWFLGWLNLLVVPVVQPVLLVVAAVMGLLVTVGILGECVVDARGRLRILQLGGPVDGVF